MTNVYDVGAQQSPSVDEANGRPLTRTPYIGPRTRSRSTGQIYYWDGSTYIPENSPQRLTPQERDARQAIVDNAQRYQAMMPDLNRFEQLNRVGRTGSVTQRFGQWAGDMPRVLGIDDPRTAANEPYLNDEMRSITDRLTPSQRVAGSGSSSNLDVGMFRSGLPNVARAGPANSNIIADIRRQAREAQDYAEFIDWYWPRTGSMTGAQEQFNQYRQARQSNPSLTWRQHFQPPRSPPSQQPAQARQAPKTSKGGATLPAGVSAAEWRHMTPEERALWSR